MRYSVPVPLYTIWEFNRALFGIDARMSVDATAELVVSISPFDNTLQCKIYRSIGRKSTLNGVVIFAPVVKRLPTNPIL
jgi:hypothetical protein